MIISKRFAIMHPIVTAPLILLMPVFRAEPTINQAYALILYWCLTTLIDYAVLKAPALIRERRAQS